MITEVEKWLQYVREEVIPLVQQWMTEDFFPLVHTVLTEGLNRMHNIQITLDMMDVFVFLLVCFLTTAVVQDRWSIMVVQIVMLFIVGVLFN